MRNCCEVINQMLAFIPSDKTEFIKDLQQNHYDASFNAPEDALQWHRTMRTLLKHIPIEKNNLEKDDWEFEVLSIFTTKSIDELKEYFQTIRFKNNE